jgi:hypothetical protein
LPIYLEEEFVTADIGYYTDSGKLFQSVIPYHLPKHSSVLRPLHEHGRGSNISKSGPFLTEEGSDLLKCAADLAAYITGELTPPSLVDCSGAGDFNQGNTGFLNERSP